MQKNFVEIKIIFNFASKLNFRTDGPIAEQDYENAQLHQQGN